MVLEAALTCFYAVDCNGCVTPQIAEGYCISLGPNALWAHQHPNVSAGVALDACRLSPLHPPCAPAGFCGAAR